MLMISINKSNNYSACFSCRLVSPLSSASSIMISSLGCSEFRSSPFKCLYHHNGRLQSQCTGYPRKKKHSVQEITWARSACYHSLSWFDQSPHWSSATLNVSIGDKSFYCLFSWTTGHSTQSIPQNTGGVLTLKRLFWKRISARLLRKQL